ncbi:MAG: hypothetical protein ACYC3I_12980 [Gemmataceae bacterium]
MPWTSAGSAVVAVAQQFNPSVISQLWLVQNGLVGGDEFQPGCIFTDMIVQVRSRQFHMLVVPEQLQFVPNVPAGEEQGLIVDKVGTIVRTLPHTPFRALGLNFNWLLVPPDGDVARLTRQLFFREGPALYRHFATGDAHFGAYLSKDSLGFRLKLDVKPTLVLDENRPQGRVLFAFNFHADLREDAAQQIDAHLLRWNDARREVELLLDSVEPREQV